MNIEEFKDRIGSEFKILSDRIQESSAYNQIIDRYQNLSPNAQKITNTAIALVILFIILSFPLSFILSSYQNTSAFLSKRELIRDLIKSTRAANEMPNIAQAPEVNTLKNMIENNLRSSNLLPSQVLSVTNKASASSLISDKLISGTLEVSLSQLNQKQIVDIGFDLIRMNSSVKMKDIEIVADNKEPKYFNVKYTLVALATPPPAETIVDSPEIIKNKKSFSKDNDE